MPLRATRKSLEFTQTTAGKVVTGAAAVALIGSVALSNNNGSDNNDGGNIGSSSGSSSSSDTGSDSTGSSSSTEISLDCANIEMSEGIPKGRLEIRDLIVYWSAADSPEGVGEQDYDYDDVPWLLIYPEGGDEITSVVNVHFKEPSYCWDGMVSYYPYGMRSGRAYTFALVEHGYGSDPNGYPRITDEVTIVLP